MQQDGVIVLDKAQGITSAHAIAQIKKKLQLKKIGHAGTLDPMATGILVCLCGTATKKATEFQGGKKTYEGQILLGVTTDTDDLDGEILVKNTVPDITDDFLVQIHKTFQGEISQIPPQVSAIKKDGKRAYDLARKGEVVDIPARQVTIYESSFKKVSDTILFYSVTCSTGTYIRSIARDIGAMLGCGGAIKELRRVASAPFVIADAVRFEDLTEENICHH
jgi:tRNA pseudouridine55 synthase